MALSSPGTQVTIIDQSQYLPAAANSVPLLVIATATNKADASGTNIATGTTSANANKLFQVTSQRDLVSLYGNPFFYKTTTGTPIQGYELNEYGLMAAYSLLGVTNSCFVLRADIDLSELIGKLGRPVGEPLNNSYWLDTETSTWGIYEFNSITGKFVYKKPIVINGGTSLPDSTLGNIGDYAVNMVQKSKPIDPTDLGTYYKKTMDNQWVKLGSKDWKSSIPVITGINTNPTLTAGDMFTISFHNSIITYDITITVPVEISVDSLVSKINYTIGLADIYASNANGALSIMLMSDDPNARITISSDDNVLSDLGIQSGTYWQPALSYGDSSKMPLWTTGQSRPRPSGSVWIKTSSLGKGASLALSKYNTALASFKSVDAPLYSSLFEATYRLDSAGGKYIPVDQIFGHYSFFNSIPDSPVYLYRRVVSGPTVVTGTIQNPVFNGNDNFTVYVTTANSSTLSQPYYVGLPQGSPSAGDFVTAWTAANIPNTSAIVTVDGLIQLTHKLGGEIVIDDFQSLTQPGVLSTAGFISDVTFGCLVGPTMSENYVVNQSSSSGIGTNASFSIRANATYYEVMSVSGGINYQVGELVTLSGSSLGGANGQNDLILEVMSVDNTNAITSVAIAVNRTTGGIPMMKPTTILSNWQLLTYTSSNSEPNRDPMNGTHWFYSTVNQVDIMVNQDGNWRGYKNVNYNSDGHPIMTGTNATNPNGPIISATTPTSQSDGTSLVYGDLWIDTSDLENYPMISRWQSVDNVDQWVMIDNTDQVSSNGIVFADARWANSGIVNPISDSMPTISSLLISDHLDLDAPDATTYPQGTLLFNTRRSGYNVKRFVKNYFNGVDFPDMTLPSITNAWVSASGLKGNGSAYMGRKAQRHMVVRALKAAIGTNMSIREEESFFNLIAAPNYPELQPDMVALNNERNNTAYIIGDTPLRLEDQATSLTNWANNVDNADSTGEDGLVTHDEYLGIFYPSGITTDLAGDSVVVPASHMMLRTFIRNDQIAYPWLAAAGTRRGNVDNVTNIGYLDGNSGEFQVIKNRVGTRDVLYTHQINPIAFFTNVGILNYGNKNSKDTMSAMDRTNVSRLVAYIRERLQVVARPFIFEPNDSLTRSQLTAVVQTLFVDLVSKRGLYDFLVVCDNSNNTPDRIDRNELWIDIAIEPVKAAEFIYIPVRILNTGAIAKLG